MLIVQEAEQQARKVERDLFNTLERIYKYRIRRDPDFPLYTSSIHSKYYQMVFATIRKAIENVHKEGIEYVGSKLKQEIFITNTDIDTIKVQAEFTTDLFFKAIVKQAEITGMRSLTASSQYNNSNTLKGAAESNSEQDEDKEREQEQQIEIQTGFLAVVKRIVISAITISFAKSILSKANQLPAGLSDTESSIYGHKVRWICQLTERSCIICYQLHNRIFYTKDAAVPLPGTMGTLGSHPNCKCYLELIR